MKRVVMWALLCWLIPCAATAQETRPRTAAEQALIRLVSRLTFNEALDSYPDLALIWAVTEGHGQDHRERYRWLERHSPCVSGRLPDSIAFRRPGNCRWSRNLLPSGGQPRGWIPSRDGRWSNTREDWLDHLAKTRDFVMGADEYRPRCTYEGVAVVPTTWDGVRYGRPRVQRRGRRILDCDVRYTDVSGEWGLHNFAVAVLSWTSDPA